MFAQPKKQDYIPVDIIESKVDDLQLLSYYFGFNKTGLYKSPFRSDSKPSFGIYQQYGRVKFKDFATGEFGGIYELIGMKERLSFNDVLKKICKDFSINIDNIDTCIKSKLKSNEVYCSKFPKNKETIISIRVRDWCTYDEEYWNSYGVDINTAKRFNIFPIDYYWINNRAFRADKLAYAYVVWENDKPYYKIYQPYNKTVKWLNNYKKGTISLIDEINADAETVVICSSVKDALCLICNFGIDCIAPQGEGFDIDISNLKERFPNAHFFVLFDNDEKGLLFASVLSEKYKLDNIVIPQFEGGKDLSDMYKVLGKDKFIEILSPMMNFIKFEFNKCLK